MNKDGLQKSEEKVKAVLEAPRLNDDFFLGINNYYQKFLLDLSMAVHLLTHLEKASQWKLTEQYQVAFHKMK